MTDHPSTPPDNPTTAAIQKLTDAQIEHLDATLSIVDKLDTIDGSIRGTHAAVSQGFAEMAQADRDRSVEMQRIHEAQRQASVQLAQVAEMLRESTRRLHDIDERVERLEIAELRRKNGNGQHTGDQT